MGFLAFIALKDRVRVFVAFFIMAQCFDLAPQIVYGKNIWDYGAVLLLISAAPLLFKKKIESEKRPLFVTVLLLFTAWLFFSLLYSLLVYGYPLLDTIKAARVMIVGYLSLFIFLRLFSVDKDAFDMFVKWFYVITFVLLIVAIIQYILGIPLLFGLHREYGSVTRYLPSYLYISQMFLWYILSKYFASESVKKHEFLYAAMVVFITATTYTRGIYLAVLFAFFMMFFLLFRQGKVKANATIGFILVFTVGVTVLTASGALDRVIGRATSGLDILFSDNVKDTEIDIDTYTGRWLLVKERFQLVAKYNPVVGYGFIHENNLPKTLKDGLKYGSLVNTPEMREKYLQGHPPVLALFSVDVGWGNIVLATGFVGFFLFCVFIVSFLISYRRKQISDIRFYHLHLASYLQTIIFLLLMFNGSSFTHQVHMPMLMLAVYVYCGRIGRNKKSGDKPLAGKTTNILCPQKSQL